MIVGNCCNLVNSNVLNGDESNLGDSVAAFSRHNLKSNFKNRHPYFDSIINFCNNMGISLCVVVFPFTQGYRNQIIKYNSAFYLFLNELKNYTTNKFKFIDCQAFSFISLWQRCFFWISGKFSFSWRQFALTESRTV